MTIFFTGIILSLLGAFGNVYRGADAFAKYGLSSGIMRMLVALIPTTAILLPFKPSWEVWVISYPLILYFSLTAGWGTWFHIRSQVGWKHNLDAFWVEIIMLNLVGKHWLPAGEKSPRQDSWLGKKTIIHSPTGYVRSFTWYIFYNFLAMSFRGLGFGICVVSILCYIHGFHPFYMLILGLSFTMGVCYHIWYDFEDVEKLDKLPKFLNHAPNALGEFLYGAIVLGGPVYWICVLISLT